MQVAILEYKSIICAGYSAVMHIHTCAEEVSVKVRLSTDCRCFNPIHAESGRGRPRASVL